MPCHFIALNLCCFVMPTSVEVIADVNFLSAPVMCFSSLSVCFVCMNVYFKERRLLKIQQDISV